MYITMALHSKLKVAYRHILQYQKNKRNNCISIHWVIFSVVYKNNDQTNDFSSSVTVFTVSKKDKPTPQYLTPCPLVDPTLQS